MNLDRLQELKQKLIQEKNFGTIWTFYMDEFADHAEFTDLGAPVSDKFLEEVIPAVCKKLLGRSVRIMDLLIISIPEQQFFHAPFFVEGRIGGLIYFKDVNMGMIAVQGKPPEVMFSRFSRPFMQEPSPFKYN